MSLVHRTKRPARIRGRALHNLLAIAIAELTHANPEIRESAKIRVTALQKLVVRKDKIAKRRDKLAKAEAEIVTLRAEIERLKAEIIRLKPAVQAIDPVAEALKKYEAENGGA